MRQIKFNIYDWDKSSYQNYKEQYFADVVRSAKPARILREAIPAAYENDGGHLGYNENHLTLSLLEYEEASELDASRPQLPIDSPIDAAYIVGENVKTAINTNGVVVDAVTPYENELYGYTDKIAPMKNLLLRDFIARYQSFDQAHSVANLSSVLSDIETEGIHGAMWDNKVMDTAVAASDKYTSLKSYFEGMTDVKVGIAYDYHLKREAHGNSEWFSFPHSVRIVGDSTDRRITHSIQNSQELLNIQQQYIGVANRDLILVSSSGTVDISDFPLYAGTAQETTTVDGITIFRDSYANYLNYLPPFESTTTVEETDWNTIDTAMMSIVDDLITTIFQYSGSSMYEQEDIFSSYSTGRTYFRQTFVLTKELLVAYCDVRIAALAYEAEIQSTALADLREEPLGRFLDGIMNDPQEFVDLMALNLGNISYIAHSSKVSNFDNVNLFNDADKSAIAAKNYLRDLFRMLPERYKDCIRCSFAPSGADYYPIGYFIDWAKLKELPNIEFTNVMQVFSGRYDIHHPEDDGGGLGQWIGVIFSAFFTIATWGTAAPAVSYLMLAGTVLQTIAIATGSKTWAKISEIFGYLIIVSAAYKGVIKAGIVKFIKANIITYVLKLVDFVQTYTYDKSLEGLESTYKALKKQVSDLWELVTELEEAARVQKFIYGDHIDHTLTDYYSIIYTPRDMYAT